MAMIRAFLFVSLLLPFCVSATDFPRPVALEPAVDFWVKVYTEVSTSQGYVHDDENLAIIYQTLDVPADRRARERRVRGVRDEVEASLKALGQGKRRDLTPMETLVLAAWPADTPSDEFTRAAHRVRFQLGQSDRFRSGLARSGQWKPHIRGVLERHELPPELVVLPHVESSFNATAWSKAAAAGMWQFMPSTARRFMRVDHVVDARMDPFFATDGAARLLKANYELTGTWPLALTGYNHGANGMMRAAQTVGTTDIDVIVKHYKGRAFGFASRNFYASFLAALQVDSGAEEYFPGVVMVEPVLYDVTEPADFISASHFADALGISLEELRQHNPALMDPVWSGDKYIPAGFEVRVPEGQIDRSMDEALASLSIVSRYNQQKPDRIHRIVQGDSLSGIAQQHKTTVSRLMTLNGLRSHRIRAGQTLILPGNAQSQGLSADHIAKTRARLQHAPLEYVIQQGDSLWSIARRFNVSTQELVVWNDLSRKAHLQPGQKLKIATSG